MELDLTAGLSVHEDRGPSRWEAVLGKFPSRISVFWCSGVSSGAWDSTQQTLPALGSFHSVLREWFSLGLLQMIWNCCFLWEKRRSRRERCFEPLSAALPGFEASAGGRGLWSEEGTRQGTEGLLLLQCVCSRPRGC